MKRRLLLAIGLTTALVLSACQNGSSTSGAGDQASGQTASPQSGGDLTVMLESGHPGSWPTGLDPATNTTGGANLDLMQAVYGGLFLVEADADGKNAHVQP